MNWIKLPDAYINLDQVRRIEFESIHNRPPLAVITWVGGTADETPHSILEGKNAIALKYAMEHLSVEPPTVPAELPCPF